MVYNPYGAGSTVYGSGSSAATTGTVDPLGYITRELEKRRMQYQGGADGQSDTRSGLAQTALQNLDVNNANPAMTPQDAAARFYSLIGAAPDGSLQYPQLNLPFDSDLSDERATALAQYQQGNLENQQGLMKAAQERMLGQRQLDQSLPGMFRGLLNNFAGRGMARSSGYGQGVVGINNEAMNEDAGLLSRYQDAESGIKNDGLNDQLSFLSILQRLATQQTDRNAQKAADLALIEAQRQAAAPQLSGPALDAAAPPNPDMSNLSAGSDPQNTTAPTFQAGGVDDPRIASWMESKFGPNWKASPDLSFYLAVARKELGIA
ncbi:MAG TPA: hypothetical protein VFK94_03765 [Patescibacteria group bacterium]|nr:hypothetical protein [Patescibacteria group bacterium]